MDPKLKKSDFAPGPGTVIAGFSVKNCGETAQNQLLRPVLKPIRGTFYFWFTNLSVLLRFARMAICDKVEPLKILELVSRACRWCTIRCAPGPSRLRRSRGPRTQTKVSFFVACQMFFDAPGVMSRGGLCEWVARLIWGCGSHATWDLFHEF